MGDAGSKKKMVTIGVSSLILVACVVAVTVGVKNHNSAENTDDKTGNTGGELSSSSKAVQALCQPTDYKQTCEESLASAGNTTDPKELVKIAFDYTVNKVKEGITKSNTLKELEKDPRGKKALDDCREMIDYALDDLKQSIEKLGTAELSNVGDVINELQIWLSASVTYQQTCLDGFQDTTGDAGEKMSKALNASMQLTSNGLAMLTNISSLMGDLNIQQILSRKLLSSQAEEALPHHPRFLSSQAEEALPSHPRFLISQAEEPLPHHPPWLTESRRALAEADPAKLTPSVVVAQDGSGKYKTINEALKSVPAGNTKPYIIYVKAGTYKENVFVEQGMTHVMIYGDGPLKTKITGSKNYAEGNPVVDTATVAVIGNNFIGRDIGFENTAGPEKHQAVALRVSSDQAIFYNCQIDGYQSTLYAHAERQFYRDCTVTGTLDIVHGDAVAVFQGCTFTVRKPTDEVQPCTITAQARTDRNAKTGFIIQNGTISADPTLLPVKNVIKSYLGRPAKAYSRTIIVNTKIDDVINPEGWVPFRGTFGTTTCFFAEINNKGPGADKTKRVKWTGIKSLDAAQAAEFDPSKFFLADSWITESKVPYSASLTA